MSNHIFQTVYDKCQLTMICREIQINIFMNHESAKFNSSNGYISSYARINSLEGSYSERKLNFNCSEEINAKTTLKGEDGGDIKNQLQSLFSDKKYFQVQIGTADSTLNIIWDK